MSNAESGPGNQPDANVVRFPRQFEPEHDDLLNTDTCIRYFLSRWRHPSMASHKLAETILSDTGDSSDENEIISQKQTMLHEIVESSQLFDHYDELLEADKITRLLDALLRSSLKDKSIALERKAAGKLMYIRAAETLPELRADDSLSPRGDEQEWEELLKRLFGPIYSDI